MKISISLVVVIVVLALGLMGASILPSCDRSNDGGVYKSTDSGNAWDQKTYISEDENLSNVDVMSIAVNPADSNIIYLGVKGQGIYKTTDGGDVWRRVLPSDVDIFAIAIDPKDPNIVYASSLAEDNGKIFKSPNGFEETVEEILVEAQGGLALVDIIIDHYNTSIIYALSEQGGIFKSTDAGATWAAVYWFDGDLAAMGMSPTDSRVIYVGTKDRGLLKTIDGGESWTEIEAIFKEQDMSEGANISDLAVVSTDTIYTATWHGLLRTNDGGVTWEEVNALLRPGEVPVKTLVVPVSSPNVIYFANGNVLHKSTNSGETWSNLLLPTARTISVLVVDPNNIETIYAGVIKEQDDEIF
ncbi:WD40/YVTN/BNR-like repeat-containing protein [Patescibacteria group bacterium]